jgi:hypothetical protein
MVSAGDVVLSDVSEAQKVITLVFMLGRDRYGFDKRRVGTLYAKLLFLHPVGSSATYFIPVHPSREMQSHYF